MGEWGSPVLVWGLRWAPRTTLALRFPFFLYSSPEPFTSVFPTTRTFAISRFGTALLI